MKKLLMFVSLFIPLSSLAGVGDSDNRYYVTDEMWTQEPYKKFVLLEPGFYYNRVSDQVFLPGSTCSAQYISPNLIVSAGHCIYTKAEHDSDLEGFLSYMLDGGWRVSKSTNDDRYQITTPKGKANAKLVYTEYTGEAVDTLGDWAVWMVTDPEYYSDVYFDIKEPTATIDVVNAGWGWARIIPDDELEKIRTIFEEVRLMSEDEVEAISDVKRSINTELEKLSIHHIEEDKDRLKASKCKIVFDDCQKIFERLYPAYKMTQISPGLKPVKQMVDHEAKKLENVCNNQIGLSVNPLYPYILDTTCDSWGGNSGGGYISLDGKYLYGTCSYGADGFEDFYNTDSIVSAKQFESKIKELIKTYDHNNSVEENIAKIPTGLYGDTDEIQNTQTNEIKKHRLLSSNMRDNSKLGKELLELLPTIKNMSNGQFLRFLDKWAEYQANSNRIEKQQEYKKAQARETSLENRTLGSLTMAATGIGGMELARGLAEQKADKAAEADMTAYMSTFQCKVGDKRYSGNDIQIEIAGGNELINLYQEYVNLANSLKERKAALGKKAGIESEVILDKANMGLYDETGKGIENGTYASLYRAARGNENDAAKIQEQKDASKKRVIAGAVVAGAGVVGGTIGNLAINGKKEAAEAGEKAEADQTVNDAFNKFIQVNKNNPLY